MISLQCEGYIYVNRFRLSEPEFVELKNYQNSANSIRSKNSKNSGSDYLLASTSIVTVTSFDITMLLPPMPKSERFNFKTPLKSAVLPLSV